MKLKYHFKESIFLELFSKKFLRIMKLTNLLLLVAVLNVFGTDTYSQITRLSLDVKGAPIQDVLSAIEDQSEFFFLYSSKMIDVNQKVNFEAKDERIDQVLTDLLANTDIKYIIKDRQILLVDRSTKETDLPQQKVIVTGTVKGDDGTGLPGVNITVEGTSMGVMTDIDGKYSLEVPGQTSVLVYSFIGMVPQKVTVGTQKVIDVVLASDMEKLQEVVVVGYGTQKAATVTGAISSVKAESLKSVNTTNLSNSFAGRLPGLVVVTRSGEPGNDASTFRIRGSNTLGDNSPLIVIDGIANRSMERLSPEDIESVTVLKDASAAIYGAQAANGVILVTTKRGSAGKSQVDVTFNQGWNMPTVIPEMADASTYATMLNEINYYAGKNPKYTAEEIQKFSDGSDPWSFPNTDWFGETFKKAALQQNANFSVNGGSESIKYFVSLGGNFQDAIYKNSATNYSQYNFRSNIDGKISKNIKLSFDVSGRQENRNYPTRSASSIFGMLMRGYPTSVAYWPTGENGPDIEYGNNPVVITTSQSGYDKTKTYVLESLLKLDVTIPWVKGLSVTANGSFDKTIENSKLWETPWYLYSWDGTSFNEDGSHTLIRSKKGFTNAQLTQSISDAQRLTGNVLLNYDRTFNDKHGIKILFGAEAISGDEMEIEAFRKYFVSTAVDQLFAGGDLEKTNTGEASESARMNYFGRINYNYREKYLAEFVWRYDGSYIFPQEKRYGFFPGISLGWRASEEDFWRDNLSIVNYFKLRGSWGQTGNDRIDPYQFMSSYGYNSSSDGIYVFNNNVENKVLQELRIPNPNVTWEVANQSNIGFDAQMFNGRLTFSGDYFYNFRNNILCTRNASVPTSTGLTLPKENIGKVVNQGVEFTVGYNNTFGKLNYEVSLNGGYQKNKIKFWDETPGIPDYQQSTGHPMNSDLYYQAIGIFNDQAEINAYPHWDGAQPGDVIFEDVNKDGSIDGLDQVMNYKTDLPTFTGGLNINLSYKNFYSTIFAQWATGAVRNRYYEFNGESGNFFASDAEGRWTVDNITASKPRTWNRYGEYWRDNEKNTYWLEKTDYLRLKNIVIGYDLHNIPAIQKMGLSGFRVYVSGVNLLTWDNLTDFDPESTSATAYPLNKVISFGANITF